MWCIYTGAYIQVYASTVQPLVSYALAGGKGTCFAFGQTGSGKTYTMLGDAGAQVPGLVTLGADELINRWSGAEGKLVSVSMIEIYGDEVYDLLPASGVRTKRIPREDACKKVRIQGLTRVLVRSLEDCLRLIETGSAKRCTATTGVNESSSRSHAIIDITLHLPAPTAEGGRAGEGGQGGEVLGQEFGRLCFVDLAGSEKGCDSADQDRVTRSEGAEINKSLLALKECIRAMDDPASTFTPFRGSKLTLVLRDSFLGQGRILMVANVSPAAGHCGETINTLRYAHRVTQIGVRASDRPSAVRGGSGAGDVPGPRDITLAPQAALVGDGACGPQIAESGSELRAAQTRTQTRSHSEWPTATGHSKPEKEQGAQKAGERQVQDTSARTAAAAEAAEASASAALKALSQRLNAGKALSGDDLGPAYGDLLDKVEALPLSTSPQREGSDSNDSGARHTRAHTQRQVTLFPSGHGARPASAPLKKAAQEGGVKGGRGGPAKREGGQRAGGEGGARAGKGSGRSARDGGGRMGDSIVGAWKAGVRESMALAEREVHALAQSSSVCVRVCVSRLACSTESP